MRREFPLLAKEARNGDFPTDPLLRVEFAVEPLVIIHFDELKLLWFAGQEFIHGFLAPRPRRFVVVVRQDDASGTQTGIEKFQTLL
jgi:hypothetical protein